MSLSLTFMLCFASKTGVLLIRSVFYEKDKGFVNTMSVFAN